MSISRPHNARAELLSTNDNRVAIRESISRIFDILSYTKEESAITEGLAELLSFFDVDRAYMGILDNEKSTLSFIHEMYKEGHAGIIPFFQEEYLHKTTFQEKELPWWYSKLSRGETIVVRDVDNMPDAAVICRELMGGNKVKSLLAVPTYYRGKINGFIGIDTIKDYRTWDQVDSENLEILSKFFSYIIEQEHMAREMKISSMNALKNNVLLQIIFEKLPVGLEIYDDKGYLIDINPAALRIVETTKEKVMGVNIFDNPAISSQSKEQIRRGEEANFENKYSFRTINDSGYFASSAKEGYKSLVGNCVPLKDNKESVFGFLQLVYDNTEDYQRNELLQNNLAKLKVAVDTGKSFIWEYDVRNDSVNVDHSFVDVITVGGKRADNQICPEPTLQGHLKYIHPEDIDRVYHQSFIPLLEGEIPHFTATYRQLIGESYLWLTTNFRTYKYDEEGKPSHIVCYTMNVNEEREMELELIKVKEADKLKSVFIENMSHEIRTPLNAIVGFSGVLAEVNRTEENKVYVNHINENTGQLLKIVDDMLDFSKMDSGELQYTFNTTDVKEICLDIWEEKRTKIKPEVEFLFDRTLPSVLICSDRKRLRQVISQLIDNALKFTDRGSIQLIYYKKDSRTLSLEVTDTGKGMSEKEKELLFVPFYKSDSFLKGTGLGLPISQRIVEALGGTLEVESEPGEGSTFRLTLPIRNC